MESNPTLTFLSGTPPNEVPITDLTIADVRLVCIAGTYTGSVIFPDNVVSPSFTNLGNGQYNIGYFQHSNFTSEIGAGYTYYVKVQRKIGGEWTDDYRFGAFWIGYNTEYCEYLISLKQSIVSGVSDTEIGYLDGVTSAIQTQLNAKQAIVSGVSDTEIGYLDGVTSAIQTQLNSKVGITNDETITGKKTFSGGLDVQINTSETGASNRPKATYTDGYKAPENDAEFIEKKYADDLVAEITAVPFQESAQKVRVIVNGTIIANQVYNNIAAAINSFSALSITKQCLVSIEDTGNASQYITLNHSALKSYAHIKGISKHINLILGVTTASVTKVVTFSDLTIWMGANAGDITTDRTYNSLEFVNCDIYVYKSLTLTNCKLTNCRIFQPTGETITADGTTQLTNCMLTNALTASGITGVGFVANTTSEVNMAYTMPTDPSSSGA